MQDGCICGADCEKCEECEEAICECYCEFVEFDDEEDDDDDEEEEVDF